MTAILDPNEMTEEGVKLQYITPALLKKWDHSLITIETAVTDGINIKGNKPFRKKPKKVDYLLYFSANRSISGSGKTNISKQKIAFSAFAFSPLLEHVCFAAKIEELIVFHN